MHLSPIIRDLAVILGVAGVVTYLFRRINQPVVLGYLVAGFIIGPHTPPFPLVTDLPNIHVLAELGVIFLMFSLGLEFTFHKLVRVGFSASGTAAVEVVAMVFIGYHTGRLLGWSATDSLFLGGMLAISSTTIILKSLEQLGLKKRRFSESVFGALVVEDLVAILLLVALSSMATSDHLLSWELLVAASKLILVVGSWFLVGYFLIPSFLRYSAKLLDNETLTVLSIGLCLLLVVLATRFHYSAALGAFMMGSILAESELRERIERLIEPVRDLFAAVFFVSVGMLVDPKMISSHLGAVCLITFVTIVGKIMSTSLGAVVMGEPIKRSFQIGFSLAQIGEFSFIIAALGASLKVTSDFLYPIAVTVSVITTFVTPYLIRVSEPCAEWMEKRIPRRLNTVLTRYSSWMQQPRTESAERGLTRSAVPFFLNGIIVTVIFLGMAKWGLPRFPEWTIVCWIVAVFAAAPFVWGMFSAFRGSNLFFGQVCTLLWLGILSNIFFNTLVSFFVTALAGILLFVFFYRRLESSYQWFEKRMLSNLQKKPGMTQERILEVLAPWDLRLVRMQVNPNSDLVGKSLQQSNVRGRFGINVVVIQRGMQNISPPVASDLLMPGDELLLLGTDSQIEAFRKIAEGISDTLLMTSLSDYSLKKFVVEEGTKYVGQTIRSSGIREGLKGLVVGLERAGLRTTNPDPDMPLQPGDLLWVVGGVV